MNSILSMIDDDRLIPTSSPIEESSFQGSLDNSRTNYTVGFRKFTRPNLKFPTINGADSLYSTVSNILLQSTSSLLHRN